MTLQEREIFSQAFPDPIRYYDIHVYFDENDPEDTKSVSALRDNIKRTFPHIKVFDLVPYPVGPHPTGMFELHLYNPAQFSQVVPWLVLNRGRRSALLHPNTHNSLQDHTTHAMWFGEKLSLSLGIFDRFKQKA